MRPATCSGRPSRRRRRKTRSSAPVASRKAAARTPCAPPGLPHEPVFPAQPLWLPVGPTVDAREPGGSGDRNSASAVRARRRSVQPEDRRANVPDRSHGFSGWAIESSQLFSRPGTRTRISLPPIGQTRRIVPIRGFGPFQNGSRKNSTPLRTASWDELASTFVAYCPPGPEM